MDEYTRHLQEKASKQRGLSNFKLKVVGDLLMFLSAASMTLVPKLVGVPSGEDMFALTVVVLCEAISWVAIPIYAWLLYSGFNHTHSWWKYCLQLALLAIICEVPYDLVTFGTPADFRSQNPVFGLVIALIVLVLLDEVAYYKTAAKVILSILLVVMGLLWNFLLRIGQSQAFMNIGMLTLGLCVVFFFLDGRENTMIFTAGLLGAVCMIAPGIGVAFLHYRNDELGYRHQWTKWVFYAVYPLMLCFCAAIGTI